jgi:hypothetical protein
MSELVQTNALGRLYHTYYGDTLIEVTPSKTYHDLESVPHTHVIHIRVSDAMYHDLKYLSDRLAPHTMSSIVRTLIEKNVPTHVEQLKQVPEPASPTAGEAAALIDSLLGGA